MSTDCIIADFGLLNAKNRFILNTPIDDISQEVIVDIVDIDLQSVQLSRWFNW